MISWKVVRTASRWSSPLSRPKSGHSFIEQELKRAGIGFRKHDNATPTISRKKWTTSSGRDSAVR